METKTGVFGAHMARVHVPVERVVVAAIVLGGLLVWLGWLLGGGWFT